MGINGSSFLFFLSILGDSRRPVKPLPESFQKIHGKKEGIPKRRRIFKTTQKTPLETDILIFSV